MKPAAGPASGAKRALALGAALFFLTALAFSGILRSAFVWDDWAFVVRTLGYRGWDWRHLHWMLTTFTMSTYAPLGWLSYALDYSLWGLSPFGFHLTNLLLHSFNAVLFFGLAARLLRLAFPQGERRALAAGAFLAALLFAVHPLRVESVSWVSQRRDLLSGLFFLAALRFYVDGRRPAAFGAFVLASLSKPSVVPLPAVLLILDFYPLRRRWSGRLLLEKAPFFLIAAADASLAIRAQAVTGNFASLSQHGLAARLAQAVHGLGFYISKTAVPSGLLAHYPLPGALSLWSPMTAWGLLILAAAAGVMRWLGVRGRAAAALWAYYLVMLSPVLGFLQNGPQLAALRYSYLACLGWALLAGAAAAAAPVAWRRWVCAGLALAAAAGVPLVRAQVRVCRDDVSLWAPVAARHPDSFNANLNLADGLIRAGAPGAAVPYARAALRAARGDDRLAVLCLARALALQGDLEEARRRLAGLLQARPDWSPAHDLLGVVLTRQGRPREALGHFERAAALDPRSAQARYNAGVILAGAGRPAEAAGWLEAAARLEPEEPLYRGALDKLRSDLSRDIHK
ncbi:MAG: tetratricopeptide repeat protein [Elusimicrobia bacterium]|nr:tetratricopeptide repeat protein [Elusimicrobiota bacterium]